MANGGRVSNSRSLLLLLLTSSFFFTALVFDYMPMIVDNQIKRTVELATNDEIRSIWSKPPIDIHSYFWLYEALNAEQFMAGEKIRVRKVGPFHFISRLEKQVIELSANKYRIVYNSTRRFYLNDSSSTSPSSSTNDGLMKLDQPIVVLNPVYVSLMEATREMAGKLDNGTALMITSSANRLAERFNETLFLNSTARISLLGRKIQMIQTARKLITTFGIDAQLPHVLDNDIFGFVSALNDTPTGPYEIYTGYQVTMPSLGDLISYQGKRRLSEYKGKCNRMQASVGELRPMPIGDDQMLEIYMPHLCRIIRLRPTGIKKLREGLAISYVHAYEDFLSADKNPDKKCFCVNGTVDNYCSLNGAIELAPCSYYSPLVLTTSNIEPDTKLTNSLADYDPELLASDVEHLPAPSKTAQLLILKRIGVPVKADLTYTLFMKVKRDTHYRHVNSVPEVSYIPVLMVRETGVIPPPLGQIVVNLENFLTLTHHMKVIMYLSTVVLLCWLAGHYYGNSARDRVMPSSLNGTGNNANGGGGNDSYSERGNSADISTRSQPPTRRTSRTNSLIEAMSNASTDTSNANNKATTFGASGVSESRKPQQQGSSSRAALHGSNGPLGPKADFSSSAAATNQMTARGSLTTQLPDVSLSGSASNPTPLGREQSRTKRTIARSSRIFSKVDDEWNSRSFNDQLGKQQQEQQQQQQRNVNHADMLKKLAQQGDSGNRLISSGEPLSSSNLEPDAKSDQAQMVEANPTSELSNANERRKRKGWFMQVYCNFVRMLTGIRGSLSEAGQLNVVENDFRDKQLEMLAGKIDNWYNSNASPVSPTQLAKSNSTENVHTNEKATYDGSQLSTSGQTVSALEQVKGTQEATDDGVQEQFNDENLEANKRIIGTNDERNEAGSKLMKTDLEHNNKDLEAKQASVHKPIQEGMEKDEMVDESKNSNELVVRKLERSETALKDNDKVEDKVSKVAGQERVMEAFLDKENAKTDKEEDPDNDILNAQAKQIEKEKPLLNLQHDNQNSQIESVESEPSNKTIDTEIGKEKKDNNNDSDNNRVDEKVDNNDSYSGNNNDVSNNNIRISDSHYIARKDSDQSNQTIINKSDTSGDESVTSSVISNDNKDKVVAFERMEMALVAKS